MKITLNGTSIEIEEGTTLAALLQARGLNPGSGIAVALNRQVIPVAKQKGVVLQQNDTLLIIGATYGG